MARSTPNGAIGVAGSPHPITSYHNLAETMFRLSSRLMLFILRVAVNATIKAETTSSEILSSS
jgi:hypothetical protein